MKKLFISLIVIMNLLSLSGCNKDDQKKNIVEEKKDFVVVPETFSFAISWNRGVPISLISNNSNLEFYCTANIGTFTYDSNVKNITIQGQDDFSWYPDSDGLLKAPVYIDIIVKKNNNNYGYCIISIDESDNFEISGVYDVSVIKSVYFPKIIGKIQNITDSDIQLLIYQTIYGI